MIAAAALLAAALAAAEDPAPPAGALEGRPPAGETSPLQARLDEAPAGSTVEVGPGTYEGDLVIDKPLRLVGRGRPLLLGSGAGSVVRVRAPGVVVEGFDVDGRGGGDLGRDSAGIHVAAPDVTVRSCRVAGALFGIYLREAHGARVESCTVRGIPGRDPGEKGSGIHLWNTHRFVLVGNTVSEARDGFYIQSSHHGRLSGNVARDLRYGLHFMFSDDNVFEDNRFENGAAGAALMYSRRLVFRRNHFVRNRGFASVGLLLKACDDVLAEDNVVADNARGVFVEGSYRNLFRRNLVAASDVALVLYDSCGGVRFTDNAFVANLSPLQLVGRRTDTVFAGNYWSDNSEPDLDGDGRSDRPYRLTSVFDQLRGDLAAADLFTAGLAAHALAAAENAFPVLEPVRVEDASPRVRPPRARPSRAAVAGRARGPHRRGLAGSLVLLAAGVIALARAGRRGRA